MTISLDDGSYSHSAYALGFDDTSGLTPAQQDARERYQGFTSYLAALDTDHPELLEAEPAPYEPEAVRVYAWESQVTPEQAPPAWPLDDDIASWPEEPGFGARCETISGPDLEDADGLDRRPALALRMAERRDHLVDGHRASAAGRPGVRRLAPLLALVAGTSPRGLRRHDAASRRSSPRPRPSRRRPPSLPRSAIGPCAPAPEPAGGVADASAEAFQEHAAEVAAAVERYGQKHRDSFAGLWIDWSFHGITAAFTGAPEEHEAALQELATTEVPVRAVKVRHTYAELEQVQRQLETRSSASSRTPPPSTSCGTASSSRSAFSTRRHAPRSASGSRETSSASTGPARTTSSRKARSRKAARAGACSPTSPASERCGTRRPRSTRRATGTCGACWALPVSLPAVDFEHEIVLHFGPAVSGSCSNIRLDGLLIEPASCSPRSFSRASSRRPARRTPTRIRTCWPSSARRCRAPPFRVQLGPDVPPGAQDSVTVVESLQG